MAPQSPSLDRRTLAVHQERNMRTSVAALAILAVCCGTATAQPQFQRDPTITVVGQGRIQAAPDHAFLTVEVVTKAKSLEAATASHRDRAQRGVNALRALNSTGLEIERSTFRLNEVRLPPPQGSNRDRGETEYQAVTTFELKSTQLDKIDSAVTAVAATGLFEVRNLRFGIDEKNPGMKTARKNAVEDARERAATYAEAAGVRLGEVIRIEDTEPHMPREFAASPPLMRSVQVIPPETLTLSATVTMTWRIAGQ
jgi:uncharacterized protein YggE